MLSVGKKKKYPADQDKMEPSVNSKSEVGKLDVIKSLN